MEQEVNVAVSGDRRRYKQTEGDEERGGRSDSISSLSICINRALFDVGGQQPSSDRRTEVKLNKKKRMVSFQKITPPEINNNYSKK